MVDGQSGLTMDNQKNNIVIDTDRGMVIGPNGIIMDYYLLKEVI